jgi:hypothetical protein
MSMFESPFVGRTASTAETTKLTSKRGEVTVELTPPALLMLTFRGHLDGPLVNDVERELNRHLASRRNVDLFLHAWSLAGYDTEARVVLTNWLSKNRPLLRSVQVLVHSKLVAMGATVASLALGGFVTVHSEARLFQQAIETANGKPVRRAAGTA